MLQMGYAQDEIQDSLINQKYDEIMATYLLLDYRNSEVCRHVHKNALSRILFVCPITFLEMFGNDHKNMIPKSVLIFSTHEPMRLNQNLKLLPIMQHL